MSASLVGSEMCIRDRQGDLPRCLRPSEGLREGSSGQEYLCSNIGATVPVSYTHLTLPTICSV
eukprot:8375035-Alexandrium_andersonii.AAC.1